MIKNNFFFIEVILPINLNKVYTYNTSNELYDKISVGARVVVNFGKSKFYTAIVYNKHQKKIEYQTKPIEYALDYKPIITNNQIKFWNWISKYYIANLGQIYSIAIPSAMRIKSETIIKIKESYNDTENLTDSEYLVLEALRVKKSLSIKDIDKIVGKSSIYLIANLIKRNIVKAIEIIEDKYYDSKNKYISISNKIKDKKNNMTQMIESLRKYPAQRKAFFNFIKISSLKNIESIEIKKFISQSNTSKATLKKLIDKNIFVLSESSNDIKKLKINLNNKDNDIKNKIKNCFQKNKPVIFYKHKKYNLELYAKLISDEVNNRKQVLFIVPEINIINKIQDKIRVLINDKNIIYYHNKINQSDKISSWKRILNKKDDETQIIIGTKQSIFLPFTNLSLIIVEDENSDSYKQIEKPPLFNAKDCAIILSKMHNSNILLSSYCPSLNSYHNYKIGKYDLIKTQNDSIINENIEIVNTKGGGTKLFSKKLLESISVCLKNKKKIILFQNRRGFAPIINCNSCGYTPQCKNCDVSLTLYKQINLMRCNYCSFSQKAHYKCPSCGGLQLKSIGVGTEQVEIELKNLFNNNVIKRIDSDIKSNINKIINDFEEDKIDILIGTQMINRIEAQVDLIGILQADNLIKIPNFRAFEKAFQSILYMINYISINNKPKVIIQSSNPDNTILKQVIKNDYYIMAENSLKERKKYLYPPYCKIIKVIFKDKKKSQLDRICDLCASDLKNIFNENLLGPNYETIPRIKNYYIKNIILKISNSQLSKSKIKLKKVIEKIVIEGKFYTTKIIIDADL